MPASLLTEPAIRPYLDDVRLWHGYVRFLGLPTLTDNPDTPLSELFVVPGVSEQRVAPETPPGSWPAGLAVLPVLAARRRLVVLGDPGSGKSTLVNWISWLMAGGMTDSLPDELQGLLPLPIIARELRMDTVTDFESLLDAFLERPVASTLKPQRAALLERCAQGRCLVLVDGLDEMPLDQRTALRDALRIGVREHPELRFLTTSRIVGYEACPLQEDQGTTSAQLSKSASDDGFNQAPSPVDERRSGNLLDQPEIARLLARIRHPDWSTVYVMPFDDARVASFAKQWYARRSIRGIARQDASHFTAAVSANPTIQVLSRMPQLLTLMALVFRVGTKLPDGRAILYDQIAEAYLRSIDEARHIYEEGDEPEWKEKRRWLARIGFEMQLLRGTDSIEEDGGRPLLVSHDQVLTWLQQSIAASGYPTDPSFAERYLDWVGRRSGLLLPRGDGLYAFVHLSFQEYFASLHLLEHLADADWVISQRDGEAFTQGDRRVTAESLRDWAGSALWQEVFVFATEQFASRPRDARRLSEWAFGRQWSELDRELEAQSKPAAGTSAGEIPHLARAELLARFVNDPHSGWLAQERMDGCTWLLSYVEKVERIFGDYFADSGGRPVLRRLLASVSSTDRFWRWVADREPTDLWLDGAGILQMATIPPMHFIVGFSVDAIDDSSLDRLCYLMPNLIHLDFQDASSLTSIDALSNLQGLTILDLPRLACENLDVVGNLPNLTLLLLPYAKATDFSPVSRLHQLKLLSLSYTPLDRLDDVCDLENLESLFIDGTAIMSLKPLSRLSKLGMLIAPHDIRDLPDELQERVDLGTLKFM